MQQISIDPSVKLINILYLSIDFEYLAKNLVAKRIVSKVILINFKDSKIYLERIFHNIPMLLYLLFKALPTIFSPRGTKESKYVV